MEKLTTILDYKFYIPVLTELLPLIFCILFYKKLNTKELKVFLLYAATLFLFNILTILLTQVYGDRPLYFFFMRVFNILEYSLISYFAYLVLKGTLARKIVLYSIIPFCLYAIIDYIVSDKAEFNNHSNIVSYFLLLLIIIYFFYEKMRTVVVYPLYQSTVFWICVGLFLYFAGTFFFFIFINTSRDPEFKNNMSHIYMVSVVAKNVILCLSLFASPKKEEDDSILHIPTDLDLDEPFPPSTTKN
ncbi:MAG: hypothetical protein QM687_15740 [Ferruginibacter sp.]